MISVFSHELQGIELGITLAIQKHQFIVHLAIDSMTVFNLLNTKDHDPPWNVIQIWRRVKKLKEMFIKWRVTFFYKETNRVVDFLDGLHLGRAWVEIRHDEFTTNFREIFAADKAQHVY